MHCFLLALLFMRAFDEVLYPFDFFSLLSLFSSPPFFSSSQVDTGKEHIHDCTPFNLDLQYLKDCGECEGPGADKKAREMDRKGKGGSSDAAGGEREVFDARLYGKDLAQLEAEASEAKDAIVALKSKVAALEQENRDLKRG